MPNTNYLMFKKVGLVLILLCLFFSSLLSSPKVLAACDQNTGPASNTCKCEITPSVPSGQTCTPISAKNDLTNGCTSAKDCLSDDNGIVKQLKNIINFLSVGVGVVVTLAIIVGGMRYMTAGANTQQIQDAKKMITNALIALIAYGLTYAFLQWLIPGGVFS